MTAQVPDLINVDDDWYRLWAPPLDAWFEAEAPDVQVRAPNTACHRGYQATWAVRDDVLFLDGVQVWLSSDDSLSPTDLAETGRFRFPVEAVWVSQPLHAFAGDVLEYDGLIPSKHEIEIDVTVEAGRIKGLERTRNKKRLLSRLFSRR